MNTTSLIHQLGQYWPRSLSRLERAYQRQVLRQAIARIYPSFARQYPAWVNYLFDEQFLNQYAFALLARYLQYKTVPTPFELVQLWAEQFTWFNLETKERHVAQLMPVATNFLQRLNKEMFS
jgi:hypothetical protein